MEAISQINRQPNNDHTDNKDVERAPITRLVHCHAHRCREEVSSKSKICISSRFASTMYLCPWILFNSSDITAWEEN